MLRWMLLGVLTLPVLAQGAIPIGGPRENPIPVLQNLRLEFVDLHTPRTPPQTAPPLVAPPATECRMTVSAINEGRGPSGPYRVQVLTPRGQILGTTRGSGVSVGRSQTHQLHFRMPPKRVSRLKVKLTARSGPTQTLSLPLSL